ncbi:MAG: hypothetical protein U0R52_08280 [Solirubrobacterales bacterium]
MRPAVAAAALLVVAWPAVPGSPPSAAAAAAAPAGAAQAARGAACPAHAGAAGTPVLPAPGPLLFGITPAGRSGATGAPIPVTPGTRAQTLTALRRLRAPHRPLVLRLNRFFWALGAEGFRKFLRRAHGYTRRGFRVELQLRYHPAPGQEGRIGRWVRFVRHVTAAFGADRGVVGIQVANEVNLAPIAPDASDSAYEGADEALVRGVIAAHSVAAARRYDHLGIGFNWVYWPPLAREETFFASLADLGGRRFARSVDWVGLDAYPGTFYPSTATPGAERDAMVAGLSRLRCLMPLAGLGHRVPIHVEENGWPTGPGRTAADQRLALRAMVGAVNRFRGTFGVTDYRWFSLRDHNSSSPNFQHHYGLLRDDYTPKPAFGEYRRLIRRLG